MLNYLNLGCGKSPIKSTDEVVVFNVDASIKDERILNFDITAAPYPFEDGMFDRIYMFHTIEHIPEGMHTQLLMELRRVLKDTGELVLAYPEFKKIAANYINNKDDMRDFWKATIYGRGNDEWDRHKALMDTEFFAPFAAERGFHMVGAVPEKEQEFNTVAVFIKCEPTLSYEELMRRECVGV